MVINNSIALYFSATGTTKKIVQLLANQIGRNVTNIDITQKEIGDDFALNEETLLIVGMPVYSGRIPAMAAQRLKKLKAYNTPAIIICVYGNRDYDDALLELRDIVEECGFRVVSAGAFIAQHSVMSTVAVGRPDESDAQAIQSFAAQSCGIIGSIKDIASIPTIEIKGNIPYKEINKSPLFPTGDQTCTECGVCVKLCPATAINMDNPRLTNNTKCISCGRCIVNCPQKCRNYRGEVFENARAKFTEMNSKRKEADIFFTKLQSL